MKHLILCDVDGTILNSKSELTDYTIEKVKEISKDNFFCLVTTTSFDGVKPIYDKLGLNTFISCENSGVVINPHTNEVYNFLLEKHFILELFNILNNNLISMFYKSYNDFFCFEFIDRYKILLNNDNCNIHSGNFNSLELKDATSLFVIVKPDVDLKSYCDKHNLLLDFFGKDQTKAIYKISNPKASKYENSLLLKQLYSFDKVIAIGDSPNDIKMLSLADEPILMKNTSVKDGSFTLSDFDNNNDGAIKAIIKKIQL